MNSLIIMLESESVYDYLLSFKIKSNQIMDTATTFIGKKKANIVFMLKGFIIINIVKHPMLQFRCLSVNKGLTFIIFFFFWLQFYL